IVGYGVLGLVFILYGGLGFSKRMQSSAILHEIFRGKFSSVFIPLLLAAGQLGWAAVNISLGGTSLATLSHAPVAMGIIAYTVILTIMAGLNLYRLAIIKYAITLSAVGLVVFVLASKVSVVSADQLLSYRPEHANSIFWGASVVVASLISFATVSPDFFQSVRTKHDVVRSTLLGIIIPGMGMCLIGCVLFYNQPQLNLVTLIAGISFATLPHIFNTVTNTDGSIALYTPALKFQSLFRLRFIAAVALGAVISLSLALANIINYLETWLKFLSVVSPIFIGVAFAAVSFHHSRHHQPIHFARIAYVITALVCLGLLGATLPVIIALLAPLVIYSISLQYRLIGSNLKH
ncbi:MAG TPA: hypothetical protein VMR98_01700, partial [Candidatus Polarisedimenticolaceae bacterium]|nr:hypothetical protein [Candidatus Polarisedimenticolaceae bacterium]